MVIYMLIIVSSVVHFLTILAQLSNLMGLHCLQNPIITHLQAALIY